jgi:site-specific DNA recombinase
MKTVGLYARVSSEQQAQQATVESQVAALKEQAAKEGYIVLPGDIYVDNGYSGASLLRPALERLRDSVASGGVDLIYVHSPDRLARRYAYQVLLLDEFMQQGTEVKFLNGPSGESAEDELLLQVQGMIAEYERAKILERSRRGKIHRAREGLVNCLAGAPYGYLYIRKTDSEPARYEILLHEAKIVRQVFEWLVEEQRSIGEIVKTLNREKVPTRNGASRWGRSTVWAMLRNPAYMGKAAYGKTEATERRQILRPIRGKNSVPRRSKSSVRDRPREEWISIDVPPIISADMYQAAHEQLERNRRLSQRNNRGKRYLLQGLIVCAQCGYAYYGKRVTRSFDKVRYQWSYYRCVGTDSYRFAGGRVCENKQVRVDQLDGYVWETVKNFLKNPKRLFDEWSRRSEADGLNADLRQQRDEIARLLVKQERSLERLIDAYEAGVLELDELKARSASVRKRIGRAEKELQDAEKRLNETVELQSVMNRLEDFSASVDSRLDDLSWEEQRQLIRLLVARVEMDEEGATVIYRVPGSTDPFAASRPDSFDTGKPESNKSIQLRGRRVPPVIGHKEKLPVDAGNGGFIDDVIAPPADAVSHRLV